MFNNKSVTLSNRFVAGQFRLLLDHTFLSRKQASQEIQVKEYLFGRLVNPHYIQQVRLADMAHVALSFGLVPYLTNPAKGTELDVWEDTAKAVAASLFNNISMSMKGTVTGVFSRVTGEVSHEFRIYGEAKGESVTRQVYDSTRLTGEAQELLKNNDYDPDVRLEQLQNLGEFFINSSFILGLQLA